MRGRTLQLLQVFQGELLRALLWKIINAIGLQGSMLLSSVIVARLIGLESFGAYGVVLTTVMSMAGVAQAGTSLAATKFIGEHLASDPVHVGRILRMCLVVTLTISGACAVALALLAPLLATQVLGNENLANYLRWTAVAMAFQTIAIYQNGALEGFGAFRQISRVGIGAGVAHLVTTTVGAWVWGLDGAIVGLVISMGARLFLYSRTLAGVRLLHAIPDRSTTSREHWRGFMAFALPAGLASLVTLPSLWLVTALLARQPDGLKLVGIFMAANQIRLTVVQVPTMLNAVSFSVLSRLKGQGRRMEFGGVFWSNMAAGAVFSIVIVALTACLAEPVLKLYGPQFIAGHTVLLILLASVVPEILALSAYQLVQSSGRMWRSLLAIIGPRDVLYLALAFIALPNFGLIGVATAYLGAQAFSLATTLLVGRGVMAQSQGPSTPSAQPSDNQS